MSGFPWTALMAAAFGRLRLAPDAFWRMTPKEFLAALDGAAGRTPGRAPARTSLEALLRRFPDDEGGADDERR
jgi:uncharacterized phage protein (TIGR02216 family)